MSKSERTGPTSGLTVTISRTGVMVLAGAIAVAGLAVAFALMKQPGAWKAETGLRGTNKDPDLLTQPREVKDLPRWGELVVYQVEVDKPDEYISANIETNQPTRWFSGLVTPPQLAGFLQQAGLSAEQAQRLAAPPSCLAATNGLWVTPGSDLVFGLGPQVRANIYGVLCLHPENFYHSYPFTFRKDTFEERINSAALSAPTLAVVRSLIYERGTAICFSDLVEALVRVPQMEERQRLVKALSRQATVLMKLRIRPGTDVDQLLQYWGKGLRMKDARPLLDSLRELKDGATLDVVHLMPPFARRRLYTYPFPPVHPAEEMQDCHWTAMNFFNDAPDDRFLNKEYCRAVLQNDYYAVKGPPAYGDVLVFINDQGIAIHSAVYIADGIVFTKNGATHLQPWTFMKLDDLVATYPIERSLSMSSFRQKRW